ncbi:response regulator transcription factor [Pelomicrobium sp. G1]|uniref:response regulator transcription factor n=1 Tax=unclassified Pelomicrobium TaxID=2815318 RepID=UPI003F757837
MGAGENLATVYIVDDDPAVRDAIRCLVESVGLKAETFSSAAEFLNAYRPNMVGCLILDVRMAGMSGLALQEELVRSGSRLPIIIITGHGDIPMAVQAVKRGALDFLEKPFRNQTLLDRINEALKLDAARREQEAQLSHIESRLAMLTAREREVLELLIEGKTSKEIARKLDLSPRTVETHRAHIMEKLGTSSLPELVRVVLAARRHA